MSKKCENKLPSTVEPRNSGKFGHPDFFRYCGVFRYLAGYPSHPKNHAMKIFFQYTRLCIFFTEFNIKD